MSIDQMKERIMAVYPRWSAVKSMKPAQIVAIYNSLREKGKFDQKKNVTGQMHLRNFIDM